MITNEQEKLNDRTSSRRLLIVLTLKKHENGIWITKLVERLKESLPHSSSFHHIEIGVRSIEDWLAEGLLISNEVQGENFHGIIGIVNRVSDAAPPALFKACCALLAAVEQSFEIPVWNGSAAYSLCGNKWRHHLLFRQAKLLSPVTMVYYTGHYGGGEDSGIDDNLPGKRQAQEDKTITVDTQLFQQNASGKTEILLKPNAGGFGAGIRKLSLPSSPPASDSRPPSSGRRRMATISVPSSFEDNMALVQQYEKPRDGKIYRVWFLNGKVQCAVARKVNSGDEAEDSGDDSASLSNEFTSGCSGSNVCKFPGSKHKSNTNASSNSNNHIPTNIQPTYASPLSKTPSSSILPWNVPAEVRQEIEDQLLPLVLDARCGSVEFLYASPNYSKTTSIKRKSINSNKDNEDSTEKSTIELSMESTTESRDYLRRLYFDLNLLSTLPIIEDMDNNRDEIVGETVWPQHFDPWLELAHAIWGFFTSVDEK